MKITAIVLAIATACSAPTSSTAPDAPDVVDVDAAPQLDAAPDTRPALVLALTVFGHHAAWIVDVWHLKTLAPTDAVIIAVDGTPNAQGDLSWNASASCCDDPLTNPDEDRLLKLVTDRIAVGDVDPAKVYAFGHSNGAFMAIRLVCDHADVFTGAIAFAGAAASLHDAPCAPSRPVAIAEVHGTADDAVYYDRIGKLHYMEDAYVPDIGAGGTLDQLSTALGCGVPTTELGARDVAAVIAGHETDVLAYPCTRGTLEHWRVNGAGHTPELVPTWPVDALSWIEEHGR